MKTESLRRYLEKIYILEANCFLLSEVYDKLSNERADILNQSLNDLEEKPSFFDDTFKKLCFVICTILGVVGLVFGIMNIKKYEVSIVTIRNFELLQNLINLIASFIWYILRYLLYIAAGALAGFVVVSIINIFIHISKVKSSDRNNQYLLSENEEINAIATEQASIIESQMDSIKETYYETTKIKEQYYNKGIIYEKYRDFVAVSSFLDYIKSGKCSALEGTGGCYAVYDLESRLDHIITKLDDIINRLDDIKNNQYMLYAAVKDSKKTAEVFYQEMVDEMNRGNRLIEKNNEYQKINAENTEAIKYLAYFSQLS